MDQSFRDVLMSIAKSEVYDIISSTNLPLMKTQLLSEPLEQMRKNSSLEWRKLPKTMTSYAPYLQIFFIGTITNVFILA